MINNFGICELSLVPVRTEPSDKSELCTQLLFGDSYSVLEVSENGKWLKIRILFDDYIGWIDKIQHFEVSENQIELYLLQKHKFCLDDVALIDIENETSLIHLGSVLPFLNGFKGNIGNKKYIFEGDIANPLSGNNLEQNIQFLALRYINSPYLWGGKTRFGIDCSGFTQQVYKILGFNLQRDAYQQANQGVLIENILKSNIGDLSFFKNDANKIIHVGIYLGTNKIIHAHGKVRIDYIDDKGILNSETKKYSHHLTVIKRII